MDTRLTEILVCPVCKGPVRINKEKTEIQCAKCALAFPLVNDIPVMIETEARHMTEEECQSARVKPVKD